MPDAAPNRLNRISLIDALRGLALVAMTIYHFTWDLEFFGWILPLTITEPGWVMFARSIATSFLFLAGFSLVLAHAQQIHWRSFWKRFALVAGAAALISAATYFAFPDSFIFFGILHAIALFSLLGLAFMRLPWWLCALAAAAVWGFDRQFSHEVFEHPALWWTGLAPFDPPSNDYVPLFPWFSATLAGMAVAKFAAGMDLLPRLGQIDLPARLQKPLTFLGRHSLVYYLVHQPVLMGLLWCFTFVAGPPDRTAGFVKLCTVQCSPNNGEEFCRPYCACTAQGLKAVGLFEPFNRGEVDLLRNSDAQKVVNRCNAVQKNPVKRSRDN